LKLRPDCAVTIHCRILISPKDWVGGVEPMGLVLEAQIAFEAHCMVNSAGKQT
jgi:hypothetical protein